LSLPVRSDAYAGPDSARLSLQAFGCGERSVRCGSLRPGARARNRAKPAWRRGFSGQHGTYSALPYEHVDPLSGNLIVTVTDLALPGNAGLDLRVTRTYNSKFHRDFEHGNTSVDEPSAVGVGWRMHFGRVLHTESIQSGVTVTETPDGGGQPLYQTSAFAEGWISKGFVRYNRVTHTAKFPNGLVYTFGHVAEKHRPARHGPECHRDHRSVRQQPDVHVSHGLDSGCGLAHHADARRRPAARCAFRLPRGRDARADGVRRARVVL
jgi:hypothetical protein